MKKPFIGVYNPSIILTYIGVFCSLIGIGLLLHSQKAEADVLKWTMLLLIASGICDLFDGRIARLCKRTDTEKKFGIQLDSLADVISFVAFPASILMFISDFDIPSVIIAGLYLFAGIMRLGWFNVTAEEANGVFLGLPVTYSAVIFPIAYVLLKLLNIPFAPIIYKALFLITGLLFILNFKLKKPGLIGAIVFLLTAILTAVLLIVL